MAIFEAVKLVIMGGEPLGVKHLNDLPSLSLESFSLFPKNYTYNI